MSFLSSSKRLAGNVLFRCHDRFGGYRLSVTGAKPLAILMYHGLETDARRWTPRSHWVTPDSLLQEVRFFERQGYRLVSATEIDELAERSEPGCAGYLLVSFDDGHANIFPELMKWFEAEKIPALVGICPGIVEENGIFWWEEVRARFELMQQDSLRIRASDGTFLSFRKADEEEFEQSGRSVPHRELEFRLAQLREQTREIDPEQLRASIHVHENMNWSQIKELAKHPLCTIALHSMHHEIATRVSADELRSRTLAGLEAIESKTGCGSRHYIYPNGELSDGTDRVLAELGVQHTYSVRPALNSLPAGLRLDRFKGYDFERRSLWSYGRRWKRWHSGRV